MPKNGANLGAASESAMMDRRYGEKDYWLKLSTRKLTQFGPKVELE